MAMARSISCALTSTLTTLRCLAAMHNAVSTVQLCPIDQTPQVCARARCKFVCVHPAAAVQRPEKTFESCQHEKPLAYPKRLLLQPNAHVHANGILSQAALQEAPLSAIVLFSLP